MNTQQQIDEIDEKVKFMPKVFFNGIIIPLAFAILGYENIIYAVIDINIFVYFILLLIFFNIDIRHELLHFWVFYE
jgi:hypothetical protein